MHTATLISIIADPKYPDISVSTIQFYKDGVPVGAPNEARGLLDGEGLKTYCREMIAELDGKTAELKSMADFIATYRPGPVDVSLPEPSAEDIKQQAFRSSLTTVQALKIQIDLGIIDETDEEYVAAIQSAKEAKAEVSTLTLER